MTERADPPPENETPPSPPPKGGSPPAQDSRPAQDWKRLRGTVVPILLLFALLFLLGHLHIDLANGYTAPRVVSDEGGAIVFYDEGARDSAFYYRQTDDGKSFTRELRIAGVLASAALTTDQLVALYGDDTDPKTEWFCRLFEREGLRPLWSNTFDSPELGLSHPRHLASLKGRFYVLGTDEAGALRAVYLSTEVQPPQLQPLNATLPGAAVHEAEVKEGEEPEAREKTVPPPVLFCSAVTGDELTLFWRVLKDPKEGRTSPGVVRWAHFDGEDFREGGELKDDLVAISALVSDGFGPNPSLVLFGVPQGTEGETIYTYTPAPEGWTRAADIAYEKEGFGSSAGISSLAAGRCQERLLLFAQVGGAIKVAVREGDAWGKWEDFARMPAEQRAVVYGWFLALLVLSGALVVHGWRRYRYVVTNRKHRSETAKNELNAFYTRLVGRAGAAEEEVSDSTTTTTPQPETASAMTPALSPSVDDPAGISERGLAFLVDTLLVAIGFFGVGSLLPDLLERAAVDPRARLALTACFLVLLLSYFIGFEALFARTPGKHLLGLEVQDLGGSRPPWTACLYRNLFRIEILLPAPWIVGPLSVLVMLFNPHRQRPGDLVARTTVRRTRYQEQEIEVEEAT